MYRRLHAGACALVFGASLAAASPAAALELPARQLSFVVEREGTPIGHHVLTFTPKGADGASVDIATDVAVSALFVTVYRFKHHSHEEWQGDRLTRLESTTDDDGTDHSLRYAVAEDAAAGVADGAERAWPAGIPPASLWNRRSLDSHEWLNTVDGRAMAVDVTDLGEETLTLPDGPGPARHYHLDGGVTRDLWYDKAGRLVEVTFPAKDGSAIRYRLDQIIPFPAGGEN